MYVIRLNRVMFAVLVNNRTKLDSETMKAVSGSGLTEGKEEDGVFLMLSVDLFILTQETNLWHLVQLK